MNCRRVRKCQERHKRQQPRKRSASSSCLLCIHSCVRHCMGWSAFRCKTIALKAVRNGLEVCTFSNDNDVELRCEQHHQPRSEMSSADTRDAPRWPGMFWLTRSNSPAGDISISPFEKSKCCDFFFPPSAKSHS